MASTSTARCLDSPCVWESLVTMHQNSRVNSLFAIRESGKSFSDLEMNVIRRHAEGRCGSFRHSLASARSLRYIGGLAVACAGLITLGCGTTHATLSFIAPSTATAGSPFTVTVNVVYQGKPDTAINGRIHFTSSDPGAVLPGDYYFVHADAGSHTWTNGFILTTPGNQTIFGAIVDATGINGNVTVAVSP